MANSEHFPIQFKGNHCDSLHMLIFSPCPYAAADVYGAMGCNQRSFTLGSSDTSFCPGPYSMAACPEFHVGSRLDRELFTFPSYGAETWISISKDTVDIKRDCVE